MRTINKIIIHCSATPEGRVVTVSDIDRWHKRRGLKKIGYHYAIYLDGTVHKGREISETGAHVTGRNSNSIGICYIGGLDQGGKPCDTRTPEQKAALITLVADLKVRFPNASVLGHRDYSPDLNGNGIIDNWEWMKACPCFDVKKENY
jgi:N-acetyl-anhydromuramyl-L-alanine amidase AmpD